ncbi:UNVERIFIED_ORG: AraC family transcriptional regulator [Providencia alcalifaciens]
MQKLNLSFSRLTSKEVHSSRLHHLHRVKMFSATLYHVTQGSKIIIHNNEQLIAESNSLIVIPANISMEIINRPENGFFNSDLLFLSSEILSKFKTKYMDNYPEGQLISHCAPFNKDLSIVWSAVLNAVRSNLSGAVQEHLVMRLLRELHKEGLVGPLLIEPHLNLTEQVRQIILFSPATPWTVGNIANKLSLGSSTLRRRLYSEGYNFRKIIEEVRMAHALLLLQSTRLPIADVALQCGYLCSSRFTIRFQHHYGCLPKNIR